MTDQTTADKTRGIGGFPNRIQQDVPSKKDAWYKEWYRRERPRRKLEAIKQLGGRCKDCGFDDLSRPEVFTFDHLPGTKKEEKLGHLFQLSLKRVSEELKKCELVCANCHNTRTARRLIDKN